MRISISDLWFNYDHNYRPTPDQPYCPDRHREAMLEVVDNFILCIRDLCSIPVTAEELIEDYFNRV